MWWHENHKGKPNGRINDVLNYLPRGMTKQNTLGGYIQFGILLAVLTVPWPRVLER